MEGQLSESVVTMSPPKVGIDPAPMFVAVEATRMLREVRGIGRYVRALLPRLVALRPGLRLALFVKAQRDVESLAALLADMPGLPGRVDIRPVSEMSECAPMCSGTRGTTPPPRPHAAPW